MRKYDEYVQDAVKKMEEADEARIDKFKMELETRAIFLSNLGIIAAIKEAQESCRS